MHNLLQVAVVAMDSVNYELEANFKRMEAYVREGARRRAQLVVMPESVLDGGIGYTDPDANKERMLAFAQSVPDGPYLVRAGRLSKELGIYLVFGFLEKAGTDLFNSCAMFDLRGKVIAKYRKVHPHHESSTTTPGRELKPFDTPIGRVGFLICSDQRASANFATLGVQGVEIILFPMDGDGSHDNMKRMQIRARENYCWIVVANRYSSAIIGPRGKIYLERYESECVSVGRVNLAGIPRGDKRINFISRRPDLYSPLASLLDERARYDAKGHATALEKQDTAQWREEYWQKH